MSALGAVLGADPLLSGDIDLEVVLIVVLKTVVTFALLLVLVMFYIWFMRKVIADMQNRIGPAKAGPWGILQTLADGIKLFFKEQSIPDSADRTVFKLAPYLSVLPAFQKQGLGGELIRAGNARCAELGCVAVIVLGHADYYPRFGFSAAAAESLEAPFSGPHFMALELTPGVLKNGGRVRYAKAFGV